MTAPYMYAGNAATITAAAETITAEAYAGRPIVLDLAAAQAITLPAATGTGHTYEFWVKTTKTGDLTIKAASASDSFLGNGILLADAGNTVVAFEVAANDDTITMDGSTTGGIAGARVKIIDVASGLFLVELVSAATGTEATPFSATVS